MTSPLAAHTRIAILGVPPPRLNVMDFLKNRANFVKQDIVYSRINDPVVPKVPKFKLR